MKPSFLHNRLADKIYEFVTEKWRNINILMKFMTKLAVVCIIFDLIFLGFYAVAGLNSNLISV